MELQGWKRIHTQWEHPKESGLDHWRGQIVGEREDGQLFYLNMFSPLHSFQDEVEKRAVKIISTYTGCPCTTGKTCGYHKTFPAKIVGVPDFEFPKEGEN